MQLKTILPQRTYLCLCCFLKFLSFIWIQTYFSLICVVRINMKRRWNWVFGVVANLYVITVQNSGKYFNFLGMNIYIIYEYIRIFVRIQILYSSHSAKERSFSTKKKHVRLLNVSFPSFNFNVFKDWEQYILINCTFIPIPILILFRCCHFAFLLVFRLLPRFAKAGSDSNYTRSCHIKRRQKTPDTKLCRKKRNKKQRNI